MVLFDLMRGIEFTKEEYAIFELLCKAYIAYDSKIASFLLAVMPKKPEETNYQFSADGLTLKWVNFADESGILGAFNPLWPTSFFLKCNNLKAEQFPKTKKELREEAKFAEINKESNVDFIPYFVSSALTPQNKKRNDLRASMIWILMQFPIIMHELYHMLQFKTSKIGYVAMRFVSIFTTIPYYMFQNASWMPTFRKFFSWDIEGQAEANGDKAPHVVEFTKEMEIAVDAYEWCRSAVASAERRRKNNSMPEKEIQELLDSQLEQGNNMINDATPFGKKWGRELFDLIESFVSEQ